jgi:hypothetical protein
VTITATDSDGAVTTTTFALVVTNVAPTVGADNATVTVSEASTAANTGTFGDVGADGVAITASVGTVTQNNVAKTWSWSYTPADGPDESQTVTITATDSDGAVTTTTFALVVTNVAPTVSDVVVTAAIGENGNAAVSGMFTDLGTSDLHSVTVDWGDANDAVNSAFSLPATTALEVDDTFTSGDGAVLTVTSVDLVTGAVGFSVASHQYLDDGPSPGNGTPSDASSVTVIVEDDDGGSGSGEAALVVSNVGPVVDDVAVNTPINENGLATVTGRFTDIGMSDVHTVTVNWDDPNNGVASTFIVPATEGLHVGDTFTSADGAVLTVTSLNLSTGEVRFSVAAHRYLDDGMPVVPFSGGAGGSVGVVVNGPSLPGMAGAGDSPTVQYMSRLTASRTNATSVQFAVVFSVPVTGVDPTDFDLARTGTLMAATPVAVSGSGANYTVTVSGITGNGTLGLNLIDDDSVQDLSGNLLGGDGAGNGDFVGEFYTIDTSCPTVVSIRRSGLNPTNSTSLKFAVTFSESVTHVDTGDFIATWTGLPASVTSVTGSGANYTVTVTVTGSGTATVGLNLVDNNSIVDTVGNLLGGPSVGDGDFTGEVYNVDTAIKPLMYWLKPVSGGTGDYSVSGSFVGGGQNVADAYPVTVNSLPGGTATISFQLYVSIGASDGNAGNDTFISGLLDILNRPSSVGALLGQPNPVSLVAGLNGINSSGGQLNGDLDGSGGLDLGGAFTTAVLPGTNGVWIRPYSPSVGVAGTARNSNGWTDILLGTFAYSYQATSGVLAGPSAQLSTLAVSYTGGGTGKYAEFWRQDGSARAESDGSLSWAERRIQKRGA